MGYKYIAEIPISTIKRIQIYDNSKTRYSLSKIKQLTGCDYIMNGTIFNWTTYKPYCNVKIDGTVANDPKYGEYGIAWNTNNPVMIKLPAANYANYIGCTTMIVNSTKTNMRYNSDMGGARGRTAMGIKGTNLVLYCTKDGSSYGKRPEALQAEMIALGCSGAIMLDGGGSSQCNFLGNTVTSTRVVGSLILVYLKSVVPETSTNQCPYAEPTTLVRKGSRGVGVKWVQWKLNANFSEQLSVDGIFGSGTEKAVKSAQTKKGVIADGIVGPATRNVIR